MDETDQAQLNFSNGWISAGVAAGDDMDETDQAQPQAQSQTQPPAPDTSSAAFQAAVAAEVARRFAPVTVAPDPQPMPQPKPPSFFQAELDALGNLVDAGHLHPLLKGVIESLIRAVESHL